MPRVREGSTVHVLIACGPSTYRANRLGHFRHAHDDGKAPATERGDGELVLDVAELRGGVEHAHVVELGEELALHLGPERVLGGEEGEAVGERAEGAAELVVPA